MKSGLFLAGIWLFSGSALAVGFSSLDLKANSDLVTRVQDPISPWCKSEPNPRNGDYFWQHGRSVEGSKRLARVECRKHYEECVITECLIGTPSKWTCVASKNVGEVKRGGYQAFSNSAVSAEYAVLRDCWATNGDGQCRSLCYPSLYSPLESGE